MPKKATIERARADKRSGKSASTQAGEFVREEIDTIRSGKHGAASAKQAIAIGLSKARRAGVKLPAPKKGTVSDATRKKAAKDTAAAPKKRIAAKKVSATRSRAATKALRKEPTAAASKTALSRQAKKAAGTRTAAERSASARKAANTKGATARSAAAKKAAKTRAAKKS